MSSIISGQDANVNGGNKIQRTSSLVLGQILDHSDLVQSQV